MPLITKQYNNRIHCSSEVTPVEASFKKNEAYAYQNLLYGRKKLEPQLKIHDLLRTAVLKRTFSKEDTMNWSNMLYKITNFVYGTIPSYKLDKLPQRYNEALLKKIELTLKENKDVRNALGLF